MSEREAGHDKGAQRTRISLLGADVAQRHYLYSRQTFVTKIALLNVDWGAGVVVPKAQ